MTKITFQDLPSTATPVNATNLNAIQTNAESAINEVNTTASTNLTNATKGYQTTAEAKSQEITNCAGVNGKLNITSGETEQDGTPTPSAPVDVVNVGSNINLFDKDNMLEGKFINPSDGNENTNSSYNTTNYIQVEANKQYCINKARMGNTSHAGICYYDANKTFLSGNSWNDLGYSSEAVRDNIVFSTNNSNAKYARISSKVADIDFNAVKIEEGSKATNYTPYNKGGTGFLARGKNIFVVDNLTSKTANGVTISYNPQTQEIILNGTCTTNNTTFTLSTNKTLPAGTYTQKYYVTEGTATLVGCVFQDLFYQSLGTNPTTTTIAEARTNSFKFRCNSGSIFNNYKMKVQLEEGSTATDWQPSPQNISVPLPEGMELCKIGTYKDYIYKSGNKWYKHKEIGKVILDGTENWSKSSTTTMDRFLLTISTLNTSNTTGVLSDHFVGGSYNSSNIGEVWHNSSTLAINYSTYNTTTLANFKTWLTSNNVIVYYVLATPVEEEITDTDTLEGLYQIEHLLMYENYTLINCTNDVKPTIKVDYLYNNAVNETTGARFDEIEDDIHELDNRNNYSTEEHVIGKWIDGKRLYSKTFVTTAPSNTNNGTYVNNDFAHNISNVSMLKIREAMVRKDGRNFPMPFINNSGYLIKAYPTSSTQLRVSTNSIDYGDCTVWITVDYTKTTN